MYVLFKGKGAREEQAPKGRAGDLRRTLKNADRRMPRKTIVIYKEPSGFDQKHKEGLCGIS